MWLFFALLSALFAGITAILAKVGVRQMDSDVATALRTVVVALFSWIMVGVAGSGGQLLAIYPRSLFFLILSGLATGASWLCYFKALQLGNVNKVVPVDKCSTILSVLFAMLFLGETDRWPLKLLALALMAAGTWLMLEHRSATEEKSRSWLLFAVLSAVFAALTSILGKIGIAHVESNLGTAVRTLVVLAMAWLIVLIRKKPVRGISGREAAATALSGVATGISWLCYYRALQLGEVGPVLSVDKMSILVTMAFSALILKERFSGKSWLGLGILTGGTILMVL